MEKYDRIEYNVEMKRKNTYTPEFKSKVVLELLSGQHTLGELAKKYQILPATLSSWNKQFQDRAADIFRCDKADIFRELENKEREIKSLQLKFGQLMIEHDWLESIYRKINESKEAEKTRFSRKQKTER